MPVEFDDLPFNARSDLTPYLIHLTRMTAEDDCKAIDNLLNILNEGKVWGSSADGFIKGPRKAACLMDIPFASLKQVCAKSNKLRYEPYGVVVSKKYAYKVGARPVLYLSNNECRVKLKIPRTELWRVVRLEVDGGGGWISWLHEREWRCPDEFKLPPKLKAVLVKTTKDAVRLEDAIRQRGNLASRPQCILPLDVVCQGLDW